MDSKYMKMALDLAIKGRGFVSPNPLVGCVIVKDDKVIGKGYHEKYGFPHAEVNAFQSVTEDCSGATLYVTLEPCSHFGKTPPCANSIINHKIKKVVIAVKDPNPLVAGRGIKMLKDANIDVIVGVLEEEALKINEVFFKYINNKLPFVIMKTAMTLDGKIALENGESKWISSEESRIHVHHLRNRYSAIMVGSNTIRKDDPLLTCRIDGGVSPIRIVLDSHLSLDLNYKVFNTEDVKTIVATVSSDKERISKLTALGIDVIVTNSNNNQVCLTDLMVKLGTKGIDSILLEGGQTLNFSALESGIVDKVLTYIAPKILGGSNSLTSVGGNGVKSISDSIKLKNISTCKINNDILVEAYIEGE